MLGNKCFPLKAYKGKAWSLYCERSMPNRTIYLHKRVDDYVSILASLMDASVSGVIEDMLKHIRDKELEEDVFGDDYTVALEEAEEEVEEEEAESESEEEKEESED